ncbi:hypothetical protein WR25_24960 isoform A [Diploscapter pachys]|uniref:Protein kinase domain-containing protein n=1 Tax=Diploscapter pachys TaxID=2018661 RepID=A0A2A2LH81_9BILA|nr:hypothetical protein WR25_24960 isoform A [Diploscapter pachys]
MSEKDRSGAPSQAQFNQPSNKHRTHHRDPNSQHHGNHQQQGTSSTSASSTGGPPAKLIKTEDGSAQQIRWSGNNQFPPDAETKTKMDNCRVTRQLQEYMDNFKAPYINDVQNYERLQKIGQGTFGEVFKARCKRTGKMVALKKILMENEKEGFPITALREVKMLQQLKHENITELIEVCCSKATQYNRDRSTFYLVFAFCEHDLAGLLSNNKVRLSLVHIKTLMKHMFGGLYKIHKSKILHRDMKAANVLLSRDGGDSEPRQLELISQLCGSINKEVWPEVEKMPYYNRVELKQGYPRVLLQKVGNLIKDTHALALLDKLLSIDPGKRPVAEDALDDIFFFTDPLPTPNIRDLMDKLTGTSYFEFTAARGAHANRQPQRPQHSSVQSNANNRHANPYSSAPLEPGIMALNKRGILATCLLGVAAVLFLIGILAIIVVPIIINRQVLDQTYVGFVKDGNRSEYTDTTKKWINPPYKMNMYIWLYNVTNAQQVIRGVEKPKLKQIGPFAFVEKQYKTEITFIKNDTAVLYRNNKTYFFSQDLSCKGCLLDMKITVPNVLFQKLIDFVKGAGWIAKEIVEVAISTTGEMPFVTAPIRGILFDGYSDELINTLCSKPLISKFCGTLIPRKIGFFYGQNNTNDGVYEVNTGLTDPYLIGKMITYNNRTTAKDGAWDVPRAGNVNGSDGQMFPPGLNDHERLTIFAGQICRSIQLEFYKPFETDGVPGYRYLIPADLYNYSIPQNQDYCHKNSTPQYFTDSKVQIPGCLPNGLLDASKCLPGEPRVYISQAHFYSSPREVWSAVEGLDEPNAEYDQTFVDLEPTTGVPIQAKRVMQINVGMINTTLTEVAKMKNAIVPVLWMNETAYFDQETRDQLANQLVAIRKWTRTGVMVCFAFAIALVLIVIGMYIYYAKKSAGSEDTEPILGQEYAPIDTTDEVPDRHQET